MFRPKTGESAPPASDYMKGPEGLNPNVKPALRLHRVTEQELAPKPKTAA